MNYKKPTFVQERFPDNEPGTSPKFGIFPSLLSIGGLVFGSASSLYLASILSRPEWAFQMNPYRREATTSIELGRACACFFPYVLSTTFSVCGHQKIPVAASSTDNAAPLWMVQPFYLAAGGALLGCVSELVLLCFQKPFEHSVNVVSSLIQRLCHANLAATVSTQLFVSLALTTSWESVSSRSWILMCLATFLTTFLAPALFWNGCKIRGGVDALPYILFIIHAAQFVWVTSKEAIAGGIYVNYALAFNTFAHLIATSWVQTSTPLKSSLRHVLSSLGMGAMYIALMLAGNSTLSVHDLSLDQQVEKGHKGLWPLVLASALVGLLAVMKSFPFLYQTARSELSCIIWSIPYFVLLANPAPPTPIPLRHVYAKSPPQRVLVVPYSRAHPYEMSQNLSVPAIAGRLPATVVENAGQLLGKVSNFFSGFALLDRFFPQDSINERLHEKVRLALDEDGRKRHPVIFSVPFQGFPAKAKSLPPAPQPAIESFKEGQYLAILCQYGIGNTFMKQAVETSTYPFFALVPCDRDVPHYSLVIDFRNLEQYEVKEDYEPYGGVAFFSINEERNLQLRWVIAPREKQKIMVDEDDMTFRRAEAMIVSTLSFKVVAEKHLLELHMSYNLLEVTNINAFDVAMNQEKKKDFNFHPLRIVLYIHLFSHGLAEELTTEHLLQIESVFPQVFALKYPDLIQCLGTNFKNFTYASDEDFTARGRVNEMLTGTYAKYSNDYLPFSNQVAWEMDYHQLFRRYAERIMTAVYGHDDRNVQADQVLQNYYSALENIFQSMPERYEQFQSLHGIVTFVADTIHHLVIRHHVYGTSGTVMAFDPRLGFTQTAKDGGPPALDAYRSLEFAGMATAYANFVRLVVRNGQEDKFQKVFDDATPVPRAVGATLSQVELVHEMKLAWSEMQSSLRDLQRCWEVVSSDEEPHRSDINFMYCRPTPNELHSGPGF